MWCIAMENVLRERNNTNEACLERIIAGHSSNGTRLVEGSTIVASKKRLARGSMIMAGKLNTKNEDEANVVIDPHARLRIQGL